jgi:hypothetical protein
MNRLKNFFRSLFAFMVLSSRKQKIAMGPEEDYERWLGI